MIKYSFFILVIANLVSSCYPVLEVEKLQVCHDFDNRLIIAKAKDVSDEIKYSTWLPFSYNDLDSTIEFVYYKRYMKLKETVYFNEQVLISTDGTKFNVQNLVKLESKRNLNSKKFNRYISLNKIDTSNLVTLNCYLKQ